MIDKTAAEDTMDRLIDEWEYGCPKCGSYGTEVSVVPKELYDNGIGKVEFSVGCSSCSYEQNVLSSVTVVSKERRRPSHPFLLFTPWVLLSGGKSRSESFSQNPIGTTPWTYLWSLIEPYFKFAIPTGF